MMHQFQFVTNFMCNFLKQSNLKNIMIHLVCDYKFTKEIFEARFNYHLDPLY